MLLLPFARILVSLALAQLSSGLIDGITDIMKAVSRLQPGFSRPFCLRRQIFRSQLPQTDTKTGIHYDQIFLRHGLPDTTMTAWVPVGDIKPHEGGLIYLEGSVASGKKIEDGYTRMSEAKGFTDEESKQAYNNNVSNDELELY